MADVPTPPKPPGPGQLANAAKGKAQKLPKWAWIAGAVILIGVAWMTWKRQSSADAPLAAGQDTADDPSMFDTSTLPGPSQGAYAGGSVPPLDGGGTVDGGDGLQSALTLMDFLDQRDERRLALLPAPVSVPDPLIPASVGAAAVATGGGPPGRTVTNHEAPPKPVVKNGKFYHVYNAGKANERWVYIRPASTAPAAPHAVAAPSRPSAPAPSRPAPPPPPPPPAAPRGIVKNGKFYHVYNFGTPSERWVYVRPASR